MQSNSIEKLSTGIEGLDRLLNGGLPRERMSLILGDVGTGKSVLAMQLLSGVIQQGVKALYVVFEERASNVIENMASFDWGLEDQLEKGLYLMEAQVDDTFLCADDFDIYGLLASIEARVKETGVELVAFDGLDALLRGLNSHRALFRELLRLRRWASNLGLLVVITAKEKSPGVGDTHDFGFMPFVADCVLRLSNVAGNNVDVRYLKVIKFRGSASTDSAVPFIITEQGVNLAFIEAERIQCRVSPEQRISSGIKALDGIIGGGYLLGSATLVSGAPGTAKTTLAGALAQASCARGEKTLFVSFDEGSAEIERNMRSVGIELQPHLDSGLLVMTGFRSSSLNAHGHLIKIQSLIRQVQPRVLLVDPISALNKAGDRESAANATERLLEFTGRSGITVLFTSLLERVDIEGESSASDVSTIADTWISLTYKVQEGERNRALTIIKSRGTAHTKQVRELILSSDGPTLMHAYSIGGEVLMGTARVEREELEIQLATERDANYKFQRLEAEGRLQETEERIQTYTRELNMRRQYFELVKEKYAAEQAHFVKTLQKIQSQRQQTHDDSGESPQ